MLGATASVMSSSPLTESKEFSYFELEITEMGNTDTNIAIGFCNKVDFNNNLLPGVYANSVGLHSFTGEVFSSGNKAASFEFSCVYGETIGKISIFYYTSFLLLPYFCFMTHIKIK